MNELVYLKKNEPMTDSLKVAEAFSRRHDSVVRAIENIIEHSPHKWGQCFERVAYVDASGKTNKMYLMNERAYSVLVMGFTGKKALEWKWKYADAFETMREIVSERQSANWIETRQQSKVIRREETDVIQEFVDYATQQGSKNPDKYFTNFSKLANKVCGITDRNNASIMELHNVIVVENLIRKMIELNMDEGVYYKDIFKLCKERCYEAQRITMMDLRSSLEDKEI